ncbi:MAG: hypothetical protein JTT11_01365 [Candidatus Brockarchaeota archaeon]|nr:hypothetical protein [Candidatus Brockarchaeota archaeon]
MREAFFLATAAVVVAFMTALLVQGINNDVSMLHELAVRRSSVTKLSSCADSAREDLERYLRREAEKEVFSSAALGNLPDPSNVKTGKWVEEAIEYLGKQDIRAGIEVEKVVFGRATDPEGALECAAQLGYTLKDGGCGTELVGREDARFTVPVRIYLASDLASSFRSTVVARVRRCFIQNIGADYQEVSRTVANAVEEYERRCDGMDLDFRASVHFEVSRDNETVSVELTFEAIEITDVGELAKVTVDGKTERVTFKAQAVSIKLTFKRG